MTRSSLQDELLELQEKVGKTMVFVTHDMDEAIKIADRICIMKDGHILQFDTPEMILKKPQDSFVANFVGTNRIWDSPEYIRVEDFMIHHPITCKGDMIRNRCIKRCAITTSTHCWSSTRKSICLELSAERICSKRIILWFRQRR